MIKNLLYIEDGSVDIESLEETLNSETKIIVYRQGSTPPKLVQPEQPISDIFEEALAKAQCQKCYAFSEAGTDKPNSTCPNPVDDWENEGINLWNKRVCKQVTQIINVEEETI